jgi:SCY1-like protein 1
MDFVKNLATKVVASATSSITFPYTIGERVEGQDWTSLWSMHRGTRKEDGMQVSIFTFEVAKSRDKAVFAKNAIRRFKTIRHPSIVHYIDSIESDSMLYLITEPVSPLTLSLKDPDANLMAWGLYKVTVRSQSLGG